MIIQRERFNRKSIRERTRVQYFPSTIHTNIVKLNNINVCTSHNTSIDELIEVEVGKSKI